MARKQTKTNTRKTSSKSRKSTRANPPPPPPKKNSGQELPDLSDSYGSNIIGGILFLVLAICSAISYFNTEGSFVNFFSNWLRGLLGYGFYLAAPAFAVCALLLFTCGNRPVSGRVFATVMLPVILAALSELMLNTSIHEGGSFTEMVNDLFDLGKVMQSGGVIGGLIAYGMFRTLSMAGTLPLLVLAFIYCFIVCCWGSVRGLIARITRSHNAYVQYEQKRAEEKKNEPVKPVNAARKPPKIVQGGRRETFNVDIPLGEEEDLYAAENAVNKVKAGSIRQTARSGRKQPQIIREPSVDEQLAPPPTVNGKLSEARAEAEQIVPVRPAASNTAAAGIQTPQPENAAATVPVKRGPGRPKGSVKTAREETPTPDEVRKERYKIEQAVAGTATPDDYVFPPLSLLRASSGMTADATDEVNLNRVRLEEAIRSFGISASVVGVIRGPTVTRYDLELDRGVKLSRITNLAGDLALSLGVVNVRIAPIPDKISTVGIEVPNRTVSTVFLGDILNSSNFSGARSKLSFSLGKDIGGNCIVGNISKLPHLLIAGTTGSGKSVCMNSLILSLLFKARPDEVKLIMIDPKMVELGIYNGIPHLYVPVVTDPKKAAGALQWAVVEMMKRYQAFSELGVRDLDSFNHIRKEQQEETKPRVVIVIDELADLMLVASKEVEESICRIAQMGRAAGMHLVIATQRPSADVITGLMKANIPSRIAFAVSSAMESRIILDQGGAEKLIGFGDMLYSPLGAGKPVRIQGSYVSDEEREEVIRFIKENNSVDTVGGGRNSEIEDYMIQATKDKNSSEEKESSPDGPAGDYDEMLPQAVDVVLEMGSCSVSMLQRRLKLGYSRAARIVDQMEELGVVGPYEGAKPRSVPIDRAGWQELQVKLGYLTGDAMSDQADFGTDFDNDENDSDF